MKNVGNHILSVSKKAPREIACGGYESLMFGTRITLKCRTCALNQGLISCGFGLQLTELGNRRVQIAFRYHPFVRIIIDV